MKTTASTHTGGALWDIGAMMAGLRPVWGVEYDPNKCKWAMRNIRDFTVLCSDVATVDYAMLPRVYHLHSSPSCKNASIANQGAGEAKEDVDGAQAICRAIEAVQPRVFTLENVWLYRNFDSFKVIVRKLTELSYAVDWWHLNAADYGVPQTRKRLILIASQDRQPQKPIPTHVNPNEIPRQVQLFGSALQPWQGWHEAVEDLVPDLPDTELAQWQVERLPEKLKTLLIMSGNTNLEEAKPGKGICYQDDPTNTVLAGLSGTLPKALLIEPTEMRGNGIQLESVQPCCTLKASRHENFRAILVNNDSKVGVANNAEHRFSIVRSRYDQPKAILLGGQNASHRIVKMTPRALARFQSVPDSYKLPLNNRLACDIIGNGVPCILAKAVCEAIQKTTLF